MTRQEEQELIDAVNRNTATVARLEETLRSVLQGMTETNLAMAKTFDAITERERRPWWRR